MHSQLPFLSRVVRALQRPMLSVAGLLLFAMMLHVVADVFARYLFNHPITGTLEIVSNYYMVAIVFLPLAMVQLHGGHVKVEIFTAWFGPRVIAIFDIFAALLMLLYVGLMAWFVLQSALHQTLIGEKLKVGVALLPVWPARWFAPIGAVVFLLALVATVIQHVRKLQDPHAPDLKAEEDEWTA